MKTLILSDETFEDLTAALEATAAGRGVLLRFGQAPPLPSDRELVAAARGGETPEIFRRRTSERDAARAAANETRIELDNLIRHAHAAGVGATALGRWSGLRPRRIYQVLESEA